MSSVYPFLTTVKITFVLPKLYLKKSTRKQLHLSNFVFVTFHHFLHLSFPKLLHKSVLLSIIKVPYKSVILSIITW